MTIAEPSNMQITAQAAEWLVRLEDTEHVLTARQQTEFFAWLKESPEHVKAFFKVADLWRGLEHFDSAREVDLEMLIAGRLPNVRLLTGARSDIGTDSPPSRGLTRFWQSRWSLATAAVLALIAVSWAGSRTWESYFGYRTGVGEQRTVRLVDGSLLQLNTRSRAKVAYSARERRIELLDGEALFSVEHEAARPFLVHTRSATVRAVGTKFDVYDHGSMTTVSVVEGVVQVVENARPASSGSVEPGNVQSLVLTRGETARVIAGRVGKSQMSNVADIAAWRERRLVFRNAPLVEVAKEFNRYNTVQIRTAEDVGQAKRLTGIFSSDHPQSLILYLQREPTLKVSQSGDVYVVQARE